MNCFSCGRTIESVSFRKIGFRDICEFCGVCLHSCVGCKYYQVGLSNDCKIPGTEKIVDRSSNNFCDEFACREGVGLDHQKKETNQTRFDDLFK